MPTVPDAEQYAKQFRQGIGRALQHASATIPQDEVALPTEVVARVLHLFSYAFQLSTLWSEIYQLLLQLAPKLEQVDSYDPWITYLEQAIKQSQHLQDEQITAHLAWRLGQLYYRCSQFRTAYHWLSLSRTLFAMQNDIRGDCALANQLALVALQEGDTQTAANLVAHVLGSLPATDPERANSYYVLGELARERRQWHEAETYYRQSLALWDTQGLRRSMGRGLRNLGPALFEQSKYEDAIACYVQAVSLFTDIHDPLQLAVTRMNLGIVYSKLERYEEALQLLRQAETVFHHLHDHLNRARVLTNIGITCRLLGDWVAATQAYQSSIVLWRQLNNTRWLCNAMDGLGLTYLRQGQAEQAIDVLGEALALLPQVPAGAAHEHLQQMLTEHLLQAKQVATGDDPLLG